MTVLSDTEARLSIQRDLDRAMFVEAAAGSGKTTALVSRVVALLRSGFASANELIIVTFTEAAANELTIRIREALDNLYNSDELTDDEANLVELAIGQLPSSQIGTIHSLAKYLVESKTGETVRILEPFEVRQSLFASWKSVMQSLNDADTEYLEILDALNVRESRWLDALEIVDSIRSHASQNEYSNPEMVFFKTLQELASDVLSKKSACHADDDRLLEFLDGPLSQWLAESVNAQSVVDEIAFARSVPHVRARSGSKKNWPEAVLESVREELAQLEAAANEFVHALARPALNWMLQKVLQAVHLAADSRNARGQYSFDDLLVSARALVKSDESTRQLVRGQFKFVLVDEFQDTDQIQTDLLLSIANLLPNGPQSFFVVGDPKQSIYRFRKADINTYLRTKSEFQKNVAVLNNSFRHHPELSDAINQIFTETVDELYADTLVPARDQLEEASVVFIDSTFDDIAASIRRDEAAAVIEWIQDLRRKGVQLSKIGVLFPNRTALLDLETALNAASISYTVNIQWDIWNTQELRDIRAVLKATFDPADEISVVAALRSPYLGCSDLELLEHVRAGGTWNISKPVANELLPTRVDQGLALLHDLSIVRPFVSIDEYIRLVVEKMNVMEVATQYENNRQIWSRVRYLQRSATRFVERGGVSFGEFLNWVETQGEEGISVVENYVEDLDDDAVRLMTIHASKGLEFDAVAVVGLASATSTNAPAVILDRQGQLQMRIGPAAKAITTEGFVEAWEFERSEYNREQMRLAYVAVTRARNHLMLSLMRKPNGSTLAHRLAN